MERRRVAGGGLLVAGLLSYGVGIYRRFKASASGLDPEAVHGMDFAGTPLRDAGARLDVRLPGDDARDGAGGVAAARPLPPAELALTATRDDGNMVDGRTPTLVSHPFVDEETGAIDRERVLSEAIPLGKLVLLVAAAAFLPFSVVLLFGSYSVLEPAFTLLTQFVLAVGTGIVLLYVVARGTQIAEE